MLRLAVAVVTVMLLASGAVAQTYVTENITTDVTWMPAGSPYIIQNNINVQSVGSLTIQSTASAGVIVEFEGEKVTSSDELIRRIRDHRPGDNVEVRILRKGRFMNVNVALAERPKGQ